MPTSVHPRCHDGSGRAFGTSQMSERFQRRYRDNTTAHDERKALNRCDSDAEPRERSGTRRDREHIDLAESDPIVRRERQDVGRQSFGVRSLGVAAPGLDHAIVFDDCHAADTRRRVQRENSHALHLAYMSASVTPAMRQYLDAKQQHRDAILLFRMGDFYEMFYEDALVAARALELTLTSRSKDANGGGIPMCGVPFHAVDGYIARLVKRGFRVAICEQVEDPRKAKGVVKREVVRVVSPGTLTDANYLDAREPAFLMAIVAANGARRPSEDVARTPQPSENVARTL